MKVNLLKNAIMMAMASSILAGCGSDKGVDYNFKADNQVEFSDSEIVINLDEDSGAQVIDLLQGATANGKPLNAADSTIFIREFVFSTPDNAGFTTPQATSPITEQGVSPFFIGDDPSKLVVQTDAFKEFLHFCDSTDERGALDADGNPTGDGIADFPKSIKYNVQFIVDNGFTLPPGEKATPRVMTLTINAKSDPITGVEAVAIDIASGGTQQAVAQVIPAYTCDDTSLTYSIGDSSIATVDSDGVVTGGATQGETELTVTSVETGLSTVAKVTTGPGFSIALVNQDYSDLGAPLGTKEVPTCMPIGIEVQPSIENDTLTGAYTYSWMSDNTNAQLVMAENNGSFGAFGRLSNSLVAGDIANLTVGFNSGYSGATNASDVVEKLVTLTAVENLTCAESGGYNWRSFEAVPGHAKATSGGFSSLSLNATGGIDGTGAYQIDVITPDSLESPSAGGGVGWGTTQWNANSFWAQAVATSDAGKKYASSVWVKLNQLPTEEIKLTHYMMPWFYSGGTKCLGFECRSNAGFIQPSATLKATTEWQLVEFMQDGSAAFTVPDAYEENAVPVQYIFSGPGVKAGDVYLMDELSVIAR